MKQGHKRNVTYATMKVVLACIDDKPKSFTEIWRASTLDDGSVRAALEGLAEFGLARREDISRSVWKGHSRPKSGWVRVYVTTSDVTLSDVTLSDKNSDGL